ncbi:MAG TPA: TonB-dependent receptor, partial [Croceibacterium sp.]
MFNPVSYRRTNGLLASCATAALCVLAQPALAQAVADQQPVEAADATAESEAIVVTGSRIARPDYEANSPIVTASEELFENSSTASIESNLNKLPQFSPTLNTPSAGAGDIQPTARNTPGSATISLRGIGTNRTLVLIDGRRGTPANASMVVDVNTIPSAAIESVEIISGGASSTYGADAVAGVTNFLMKDDFVGLELDGQVGLTQEGDGLEYQISGIMGADFEDGRGNVSLAFSHTKRETAYNRKRDWYTDMWADPSIAGSGFFPQIPGVNLGFGNDVDPAVMASIFNQATTPVPGGGTTIYVNPDGSVFSGFDAAGTGGAYRNEIVDGYNYKLLDNGQLGANFVDGFTAYPSDRYNLYLNGDYELNDSLGVFVSGLFSKSSSHTVQEPAPVFGGWSAMVPYNPAAPQADIPTELRQILNARANPNAPFQIFQMMPFNRESDSDVYTFNLTGGLEGKIGGSDWTWEAFANHGETMSTVTQSGFASLQRYRQVISFGNFGQGFSAQGNPEFGGFGASTATCTSGLNPFSGAAVSQDCIDAISADLKTKATMRQTIFEANAQGSLFALPAGDVRAAIGVSSRKNDYEFETDTLNSQGQSFLEQPLGLYPSGNSAGTIKAKEAYAELLVPVLEGIPFIESFNLELGARYSDYNTTGGSWTYKVLGEWEVNEWLRFRGGYNRAERAPNVAELYLAPEQTFAFAAGGDLCSRANTLPYSANPDNANGAEVEALCRVLMERSGDPTADENFYDLTTQPVGGAFVFPTLSGNANLKPEKADTWTAGAVINSPFEGPALERLRLSVDYYNIKVTDAIGAQSVDIAQRQCFDAAFNPTFDADSPFCAGIGRNTVGSLGNVITTFYNNGRFQTSGIDVQLDWAMNAGPGQVTLNSVFNYLLEMKSAELPNLPLIDYVGTLGPSNNGLNGGSYEWKLFTTLGYKLDRLTAALQWQHRPGVNVESEAVTPGLYEEVPAYDLFSLTGSYEVVDDTVLRFGIDNLFNKRPPLTGVLENPAAG